MGGHLGYERKLLGDQEKNGYKDKFSLGQVKLQVVAEHGDQDVQKFLGNMIVDFITR